MEYQQVVENWKMFANAIDGLGGDIQVLSVEDAANESELKELERYLGFSLPSSLRDVLIGFSKKVQFRWFLPDGFELEGALSQIFSGDMHWSLEWIKQFNEDKNGWITEVFPNRNDPYDSVWYDKLAFNEVGNGDYLAIDISSLGKEAVVYLSHDDGDGHGMELARNFKEFVLLTSRLGCVGAEDWQWLPFVENGQAYLNPDCENARKFRELLGVKA